MRLNCEQFYPKNALTIFSLLVAIFLSSTAFSPAQKPTVEKLPNQVTFIEGPAATAGEIKQVSLLVVTPKDSRSNYILGWIDFNKDGDFEDANERIVMSYPLGAGIERRMVFTFRIPEDAICGETSARFKISDQIKRPDPVDESEGSTDIAFNIQCK